MTLELRVTGMDLADALQEYIERRLQFGLGRFRRRIGRVVVRLSDLNGPRGGVDKRCRVSVELLRRGNVVVEETDSDLYGAINRATDRAGNTVARELKRARDWRRHAPDTARHGS